MLNVHSLHSLKAVALLFFFRSSCASVVANTRRCHDDFMDTLDEMHGFLSMVKGKAYDLL